ncbi:MAG: hypothetical protein Q9O24_11530 [Gammaproteobacteria bacterium]|nr:hypothetical protein [Gammaproteobacteria bacterium]
MLRRLYFLFPDEKQAQPVVKQLVELNIPKRRIHAIAHNIELNSLPQATQRQQHDSAFQIEQALWASNLILFGLAFVVFVTALVSSSFVGAVSALSVMALTFVAGEKFVVHLPNVHLTEFSDALAHGEILLMIDVPKQRVAEIETLVHQHYPVAVVGGVSWSADAFGL